MTTAPMKRATNPSKSGCSLLPIKGHQFLLNTSIELRPAEQQYDHKSKRNRQKDQ
jgi:hypothetical protein